ncbi:MAG: LEA type 2 family protein [Treponema sp.]|nr:LEA type 2 family protein [Treponema sp.]MCL2272657.1 LEA type 2 family protein [Treponema sp.]
MKKLLVTLIILCALLSLTTCQTLETLFSEPLISLHSVELGSLNFNSAQILCKLAVENPNIFDIPFPEVGWEIFLNANSFISGIIKNDHKLKARNETIVEVPVSLDFLDIFNVFTSLKGRAQTDYKVALAAKFAIPLLGDKIWNFAHEGNFPMLQLPKISAPSIRVNTANLSGVEFAISMNVENPNGFQLPAPKINFDYKVNNTSLLRNTFTNRSELGANSVTPVIFGIHVLYSDLFRVLPALRTSISASSELDMTFDFGIPAFKDELVKLLLPANLPISLL